MGGSNGIDEIIKVNLPWGVYHHSLGDFFNGMSYQYVKAPIGVFPILDGSDAKVLLIYLINTANYWKGQKNKDEFPISIDSLCKMMEISPNTLNKAIKQLVAIRVLSRNSAGYGNGKQTATYKINWDNLERLDKATKEKKEDIRLEVSRILERQYPLIPTSEAKALSPKQIMELEYKREEEEEEENRKWVEEHKNSQSVQPEDDDYDDGTYLPF